MYSTRQRQHSGCWAAVVAERSQHRVGIDGLRVARAESTIVFRAPGIKIVEENIIAQEDEFTE
jgi:hypothetical protein